MAPSLSEGQDLERQLERGPRRRPRSGVLRPWGLAKPAGGEKASPPSGSIETGVPVPIHGIDQAARFWPNCFARPPATPELLQWELTLWTYEGPPRGGRAHRRFDGRPCNYVLHAPQGDTYGPTCCFHDESSGVMRRPPVTYNQRFFRP